MWVAAPILPGTTTATEARLLKRLDEASDDKLFALLDAHAGSDADLDAIAGRREPYLVRQIVAAKLRDRKVLSGHYKHVDGTSFSAPIVSSIVAQMLEARPNLTPREVKQILCDTAVLLAGVPPEVQGHGLVAPDRALDATLSLVPEPKMML